MKNGFKVIDIENHYATQKATEAVARFYPDSTVCGAADGMKKGVPSFGISENRSKSSDHQNSIAAHFCCWRGGASKPLVSVANSFSESLRIPFFSKASDSFFTNLSKERPFSA